MFLLKILTNNFLSSNLIQPSLTKTFSTSNQLNTTVQFMTRIRIVDDSKLAREGMNYKRAPKVIHVYNKKRIGNIGDKILLAVKGQKQKAIIVGCKNNARKYELGPNFDTNNCVLVDDQLTPLGSRILVPIPSTLRSNPDCAKLVAIATKFV